MKFTIAIPAFKARYLKECLESVLSQTVQDFELLVVDDASPDDIAGIVRSFDQDKIQYLRNETNTGSEHVVDNWNRCVSLARGEYFVLLGDDDKLAPNYLEEFSLLIEKYPDCNVYHCRSLIIDSNSNVTGITEPRPEFEKVYDSILQRIKGNRIFFISDYLFRTSELKTAGGFFKLPLAWASDDISSYIATTSNGIAHTNNPVFMYRHNAFNISSTGNIDLKMDAIAQEKKWLQHFLSSEVSDQTQQVVRNQIQQYLPKYVKKKRIYTIYTLTSYKRPAAFLKLARKRKSYDLSLGDIMMSYVMSIREGRQNRK